MEASCLIDLPNNAVTENLENSIRSYTRVYSYASEVGKKRVAMWSRFTTPLMRPFWNIKTIEGKSGISSANLAFNRQQWVRKHPIERRNGPITVNCLAGDRYVLHDIFQRGCCLQVKLSTSGKLFASVLSWYAPTRGT